MSLVRPPISPAPNILNYFDPRIHGVPNYASALTWNDETLAAGVTAQSYSRVFPEAGYAAYSGSFWQDRITAFAGYRNSVIQQGSWNLIETAPVSSSFSTPENLHAVQYHRRRHRTVSRTQLLRQPEHRSGGGGGRLADQRRLGFHRVGDLGRSAPRIQCRISRARAVRRVQLG